MFRYRQFSLISRILWLSNSLTYASDADLCIPMAPYSRHYRTPSQGATSWGTHQRFSDRRCSKRNSLKCSDTRIKGSCIVNHSVFRFRNINHKVPCSLLYAFVFVITGFEEEQRPTDYNYAYCNRDEHGSVSCSTSNQATNGGPHCIANIISHIAGATDYASLIPSKFF